MVTSIIAWKNSGLWQLLVAGYVTGAFLVYGWVYGMPRRTVMLGAGALLLKETVIPPGSLVLGNRARTIRPVNAAQTRAIEEGWRANLRLGGE